MCVCVCVCVQTLLPDMGWLGLWWHWEPVLQSTSSWWPLSVRTGRKVLISGVVFPRAGKRQEFRADKTAAQCSSGYAQGGLDHFAKRVKLDSALE